MTLTKTCIQCGAVFEKSYNEGRPAWERRLFCSQACKSASQRGKATWNKGLKQPRPHHLLPCRICGKPTKYHGNPGSSLDGMVHCDDPACTEQSKQLKNDRISTRHTRDYATGKRKRVRHTWDKVQRISPEEQLLAPWLIALGYVPQYRFLTGVHTNKLPRQFILDFALPVQCLYIEIDGSVHRLRRERDARKDAMMSERGWKGLRVPSRVVRRSPDEAKAYITEWVIAHQITA